MGLLCCCGIAYYLYSTSEQAAASADGNAGEEEEDQQPPPPPKTRDILAGAERKFFSRLLTPPLPRPLSFSCPSPRHTMALPSPVRTQPGAVASAMLLCLCLWCCLFVEIGVLWDFGDEEDASVDQCPCVTPDPSRFLGIDRCADVTQQGENVPSVAEGEG